MDDLVTYQNQNIEITIPRSLKAKKGRWHFEADHRRIKNPDLDSVAIEMPYTEERADETMLILSRTLPSMEWGCVRGRTIQMGEVWFRGKGYELLHESHGSDTNTYIFRYDRIFCLPDQVRYASAIFSKVGPGPIANFHRLCCQIVESIQLKPD